MRSTEVQYRLYCKKVMAFASLHTTTRRFLSESQIANETEKSSSTEIVYERSYARIYIFSNIFVIISSVFDDGQYWKSACVLVVYVKFLKKGSYSHVIAAAYKYSI